MFHFLAHAAGPTATEMFKQWIHDWGDIVLTVVIAWAAVMQWIVAARLLKLQRTVEDSHRQVKLFCRINADLASPRTYARLQVSNLSRFAVWLEGISHVYTIDGENKQRELPLSVQEVLQAGETYRTTVSGNIQGFLMFERHPGSGRLSALEPVACTVRTQLSYWANGAAGTASTPLYRMAASENGLDELQEIRR
jgi:hypothetical protein